MTFKILAYKYAPFVETSSLELALSFLDFSPWTFLGTFSIFLPLDFQGDIMYFLVCEINLIPKWYHLDLQGDTT